MQSNKQGVNHRVITVGVKVKYSETVYEREGKNMFWSIENSGGVFSKFKDRGFQATSLPTYDFFYRVHNITP